MFVLIFLVKEYNSSYIYEFLGFDGGQMGTNTDKRWQGDSLHEMSCGKLLGT